MKIKSIEYVYTEKTWVKVIFDNGTEWYPAFNDLGKIINMIGYCEDEKYPNGKGKDLVREFLEDAIYYDISYEEFCKKRGIITNRKELTKKLI